MTAQNSVQLYMCVCVCERVAVCMCLHVFVQVGLSDMMTTDLLN